MQTATENAGPPRHLCAIVATLRPRNILPDADGRELMRATSAALAMGLLLAPSMVQGQGFGIYEQGTCSRGRAGAGVAEPCNDGSALFVNPAGLTGRPGILIGAGGSLIIGSSRFTSDIRVTTDLERNPKLAPHGYLIWGATERLAIGVGVYTPYGLGLEWPADFEGRFLSYKSELQTLYVQPTVAYALHDRVSVGAGLTIARGRSIKLYRREDLSSVPLPTVPGLTFAALVEPGTDFADTRLDGSAGTRLGANLGVLVKVSERLRAGAKYLTATTLEFEGTATFRPAGQDFVVTRPNVLELPVGTPLTPFVGEIRAALQDQPVRTELDMPAQFVAGVSVHPAGRLTVLADYHWVGWSAFDRVALDFAGPVPADEVFVQNYRDTSALRVGIDVEATQAVRLRAGYAFTQAAAPDETVTPLLPESRRNHMAGGIGWRVGPAVTVDVAYHYIRYDDRRGRVVNPPPRQAPTPALNSGVYQSRGDLLGITLTYRP
jgi:long-chain fatty acid transport protein